MGKIGIFKGYLNKLLLSCLDRSSAYLLGAY